MKRALCVLLIMFGLLLSVSSSFAIDSIDYSSMSIDDLRDVLLLLNSEYINRGFSKAIKLPIGQYVAGVDIPIGTYKVTAATTNKEYYPRVQVYSDKKEASALMSWPSFSQVLPDYGECMVNLESGNVLVLESVSYTVEPFVISFASDSNIDSDSAAEIESLKRENEELTATVERLEKRLDYDNMSAEELMNVVKKISPRFEMLSYTLSVTSKDGSSIIDAITNNLPVIEIPQDEKDNEVDDTAALITVKECGFYYSNGYWYYSFKAHNNMTDKAAYFPSFRITIRDANGGLISTEEQPLRVIYPEQDTAYANLGGETNEIPASIEITYIETDDDWRIVDPSSLDHATYIPIVIKGAKVSGRSIVGELYNPNDYNQSSIAVTVMFRNKDGHLLGGNTTYIRNVKARETVPFEISHLMGKMIDEVTFEVFAQPWH